jgi:hypothetical protein
MAMLNNQIVYDLYRRFNMIQHRYPVPPNTFIRFVVGHLSWGIEIPIYFISGGMGYDGINQGLVLMASCAVERGDTSTGPCAVGGIWSMISTCRCR